ncbi:hypothetical protein MSG45_17925, partial [Escherichia coli]
TGGTADRNRSHWSTSKTPSYTKSVSWQHHPPCGRYYGKPIFFSGRCHTTCCFRLFLNFLFKRQKENETDV